MSVPTTTGYSFTPSVVVSGQIFTINGTISNLNINTTYQISFINPSGGNIITPGSSTFSTTTFATTTRNLSLTPGTFSASSNAVNGTYPITLNLAINIGGGIYDPVPSATATANITVRNPLPCFKEGTKILTDQGYKTIEDLQKGDLVKTLKHGFLPVEILGKSEMVHQASNERLKDQLYKCGKENYPDVFEPLIITGCHSILVEWLCQEQFDKIMEDFGRIYETDGKPRLMAYLDNKSVVYETPGTYTIYHLALENEDYYGNYGIYANGLLVESCSKRYLLEHSNMELLF